MSRRQDVTADSRLSLKGISAEGENERNIDPGHMVKNYMTVIGRWRATYKQ
ncbi:MAG: hypothetical protein K6G85_04700 [Eubacterium sp.]|nr:hypothetical protein [Eubacterium sp.]